MLPTKAHTQLLWRHDGVFSPGEAKMAMLHFLTDSLPWDGQGKAKCLLSYPKGTTFNSLRTAFPSFLLPFLYQYFTLQHIRTGFPLPCPPLVLSGLRPTHSPPQVKFLKAEMNKRGYLRIPSKFVGWETVSFLHLSFRTSQGQCFDLFFKCYL